MKHTVTHLMGH